jgi:hypothetical protein
MAIAADVPKQFLLNRLSYHVHVDLVPEGIEK